MEFNFKIQKDRLIAGSVLSGNSGNMGMYVCNFDIADNADFIWLCVFKNNDTAYQQVIENGRCAMPVEVLESPGTFQIGCYGTDENMRISTNWLEFSVTEGAYCEATIPREPTPDVWEELVMRTLPYIGETGNWYVYDKEAKTYVDSGMPSRGEKGDADSEVANALKGTANGEQVIIADISPVEHTIKVRVSSENAQVDLTKVTVTRYGEDSGRAKETYIPNEDGTVEGVVSLYPITTLSADTQGVTIDCEYNKDTNKAFEEIESQLGDIETILGGI